MHPWYSRMKTAALFRTSIHTGQQWIHFTPSCWRRSCVHMCVSLYVVCAPAVGPNSRCRPWTRSCVSWSRRAARGWLSWRNSSSNSSSRSARSSTTARSTRSENTSSRCLQIYHTCDRGEGGGGWVGCSSVQSNIFCQSFPFIYFTRVHKAGRDSQCSLADIIKQT